MANKKSIKQKKSLDDLLNGGEIRTGREVIKQLQQKAAELEVFKKAAEDEMRHRRSRAK